jgi:hypothetical protein
MRHWRALGWAPPDDATERVKVTVEPGAAVPEVSDNTTCWAHMGVDRSATMLSRVADRALQLASDLRFLRKFDPCVVVTLPSLSYQGNRHIGPARREGKVPYDFSQVLTAGLSVAFALFPASEKVD